MINNIPFFRFPFYTYPRNYSNNFYHQQNAPMKQTNQNAQSNSSLKNVQPMSHAEKEKDKYNGNPKFNNTNQKKSSKYSSFGPIFINTNGFSNKEEPVLELSGLKLYLDDLIILSLLFFLYKEEVKDDMLFMLLILLLIS